MDEGGPLKQITAKVLDLIASEVDKPEMQVMLKQRIILPVINMIYIELRPYIMAISASICILLLFSLLTFICFVLYYFRK